MGTIGNTVAYVAGVTYPWRETEAGWWLEPSEGGWHPLPPMPVGRAYTAGASHEDALFVIGGRRKGAMLKDSYRLALEGGEWTWQPLPELRHARGLPAAALAYPTLFAIGGGSWGMGAFLPDDVAADEMLNLERPEEGWAEMPRFPGRRRAGCCAAALKDGVYVFGGAYACMEHGIQRVARLRDAWHFDTDSGEWTELAPLPCAGLSGAAAVPFGSRYIIILGGAVPVKEGGAEAIVTYRADPERRVNVGWYNEDVFVYDVKNDRYHLATGKLPMGTHDIRAAVLCNQIYAVGGENADPSTSNTCSHVRIGAVEATKP